MTIRDELLNNEEFNKTALKLMIEDEFKRVLGLISKAECSKIIEKHRGKDPYALYTELKSITAKKEEPKTTNTDCKCDGGCECEAPAVIVKLEEIIVSRLEKLACDLGKSGNKEAAYEVERIVNQFK